MTKSQRIALAIIAGAAICAVGIVEFGRSRGGDNKIAIKTRSGPASAAWLRQHAVKARDGVAPREGGEQPIDWSQPFVDDRPVADATAAATHVAFPVITPAEAGQPVAVVVHRSFRPQAVGLVFERTAYGRFYIIEEPSGMTQHDLEALAVCDPSSGCVGTWNMVSLADGTRALLVSNSPQATTIGWLHKGVEFMISGPPDSFSATSAVAVANLIEARA